MLEVIHHRPHVSGCDHKQDVRRRQKMPTVAACAPCHNRAAKTIWLRTLGKSAEAASFVAIEKVFTTEATMPDTRK